MKEKYLVPGSLIGTEEEYLSGNGTYVDNGCIRASLDGIFKQQNKYATVYNPIEILPLTKGIVVIGVVVSMGDTHAVVRIMPIEQAKLQKNFRKHEMPVTEGKRIVGRSPNSLFTASLHISNISRSYLKNIRDAMKIGDIIKAVVIDANRRTGTVDISTASPKYGVILGYCSKCRVLMRRKGNVVTCPACNLTEKKKLSNDYGAID